ncbi:MAG: PHB depolymerase family esterase, partial [Xanthomonadales bacterium]|nr:PHB depolymerase family esterase [Xanthomonadales bacterium]
MIEFCISPKHSLAESIRRLSRHFAAGLILLCLGNPAFGQTEPNRPLPHVNGKGVTVSGISSGGAMAQQLQFAYADRFQGAGIIAGVPFGCAEGDLGLALGRCVGKEEGALPVDRYRVTLAALASEG